MAKKKRPRDINQLAKLLTDQATGEAPPQPKPEDEGKNPAAVALGRLGGHKGGKARALKLSKKRRREIAKEGAAARWKDAPKRGSRPVADEPTAKAEVKNTP